MLKKKNIYLYFQVITAFDIIRIVKCQVPERFNARQRSRNIGKNYLVYNNNYFN